MLKKFIHRNLHNIQRFLGSYGTNGSLRWYCLLNLLVNGLFFSQVKIRNIFCFIFFLSFANLSPAQILVGPVAGGQYSWISYDDEEDKDRYKVKPVSGFHAGATLSFLVRKRFFLHSSILYSTKGKVIEGREDKLLKNEVQYRYIDVPILYTVDFRAKIGRIKEFKYYFGIGPNISYWLGGKGKFFDTNLSELGLSEDRKYKIVFNKSPEDTKPNEMSVEDVNRLQLGLNLAAGAVFEPFGYHKIMFTIRYELGHSFLSRTSHGTFADSYHQDVLRSRNQGFRISLAYLVDLQVKDRKRGKSTIDRKRL
jgi:hypothetical protein